MRLSCLSIFILLPLCAAAQEPDKPLKKFVVADIETRVPIRNVIVTTGDGYRDTTNYRGVCYIPVTFDTLTVSKANYLTERILPQELKDSTFLIPNSRRISEVTVWGKQDQSGIFSGMDRAIQEGAAAAKPSGIYHSFDFAKMLDRRYRRDQKHLRKTRQIFKEMDVEDEDPIVNAYKKAMEAEQLKAEEAKKLEEQKARLRETEKKEIEKKMQQTTTQP